MEKSEKILKEIMKKGDELNELIKQYQKLTPPCQNKNCSKFNKNFSLNCCNSNLIFYFSLVTLCNNYKKKDGNKK